MNADLRMGLCLLQCGMYECAVNSTGSEVSASDKLCILGVMGLDLSVGNCSTADGASTTV